VTHTGKYTFDAAGKLTPDKSATIEDVPDPDTTDPPAGKVQLYVQDGSLGTENAAAVAPQSPLNCPVILPG
jgi:hypothetical protein